MNGKIAVALAAAFGGISPHLFKIALCLTAEPPRDPGVNSGYIFGLVLFAALGGAVALIWGEKDLKKAFYLGIGLPSMLHVVLSGTHRDQRVQLDLFATPAYAEPLQQQPESTGSQGAPAQQTPIPADSTPSYQKNRSLTLLLDDVPRGTEILFTSEDGSVTLRESVPQSEEDGRADFRIPDFATRISLKVKPKNLDSKSFRLFRDPGSTTRYKVDIDSDFLGGFLRALGVEGAHSYKFEVKPYQL